MGLVIIIILAYFIRLQSYHNISNDQQFSVLTKTMQISQITPKIYLSIPTMPIQVLPMFRMHKIKPFFTSTRYQHFTTTVHSEEVMFQRDKILINVKDIIKTKRSEIEKMLNEVLINVVKMLDKQKQDIFERFNLIEEKFQQFQTEYKKKLQLRFDCLQYLTSYKSNVQALQARLYCSSEWGIVNLKNILTDLKMYSSNQARNVNLITQQIVSQTQNVLKEQNNFIKNLKAFISGYNTNKNGSSPFGCNNDNKLHKPPLNKITKIKLSNNTQNQNNLSFLTANTRNSLIEYQQKREGSSGGGIGRPRINSLSAIRNNSPSESQSSRNRSMHMISKIPSLQKISNSPNKNQINYFQGQDNNIYNKFLKLSKVIQF